MEIINLSPCAVVVLDQSHGFDETLKQPLEIVVPS